MTTVRVEDAPGIGCRDVHACSLCAEQITWEDGRMVRVLLDGASEQIFHPSCLEIYAINLDLFAQVVVRSRVVGRAN